MEIVTGTASAHIRQVRNASTRRIRIMTQTAISEACRKVREQGARPLSAVDDLTMHRVGPWIGIFARCLARSARREKVSIAGGEMAQMPNTYKSGYVGIVVTVVGVKSLGW